MKFLILISLIFYAFVAHANVWEFRVSDTLATLESESWNSFPADKNPLSREFEGYAEYRTFIEDEALKDSQGIYLGKIGDADKTFLNGHQIGQTGNFPPQYSYNMDTERVYFVPDALIRPGKNELKIKIYSKFLVNKGFSPTSFRIAPIAHVDSMKYSSELLNNLSKIIIPILCLVLAAVSFPLLAPKHLWNTQVMIFLVSLSSFILGICRGRLAYHYFDMLMVYKITLISSVFTVWLVSVLMTKQCISAIRFLPSTIAAFLITTILISQNLMEAASWGRVWFHISPFFLIFALYGVLKTRPVGLFRLFGLAVLLVTNINDNLNDLRIISSTSLLQFGLGTFIFCMVADQILGLKKSWERYFMKEVQLEIDAKVGRQAIQIAHDLRSPIEAIKLGIYALRIDSEIEQGLRTGLKRMHEICESLLSQNKAIKQKHTSNEIETALDEVRNELLLKHPDRNSLAFNVEPHHFIKDIYFDLDLSNLKRTFCNLINNAVEACSINGNVKINLAFLQNGLQLQISDNGIGIPETSEQLFERGYTTKVSGNGLGLCAAKDYLESLGGSIQLERLSQGTSVTVFIPSCLPEQTVIESRPDMILIDDDPLVRFNWRRQGQHANLTVQAFGDFNEFLKSSSNYSRNTPIYIDSNLGEEKGEDLSEELVRLGFKKVVLSTGSPESSITNRRWISKIVGKSFDLAVHGQS
jgi:signal transduction histidine kinase